MHRSALQALKSRGKRRLEATLEMRYWLQAIPSGSALPTFLLVGTPQSGSTWLHANLIQHPAINVPWEEMVFWSRFPNAPIWWYALAFNPKFPIRGDMTPHYCGLAPRVISRIRQEIGGARLLMIVRDPVERAWSGVRRRLPPDRRHDVSAVAGFLDSAGLGYPGIAPDADFSRYSVMITRWLEHFPEEALHIVRFERITSEPEADPTSVVKDALLHVGASPASFPWGRMVRSRVNANPEDHMPINVRRYLEDRYAGEREWLAQRVAT